MNPFQKVYDAIKYWKAPQWLKIMLQEIQDMITVLLLQLGKEYLSQLKYKIIEAEETGMSPEKKFEYVFKWAKKNIPNIKDSVLNALINVLVLQLKKKNFLQIK